MTRRAATWAAAVISAILLVGWYREPPPVVPPSGPYDGAALNEEPPQLETRPAGVPIEPESTVPGSVLGVRNRRLDTMRVAALAAAYPESIQRIARRNGDWALEVDGRWFHWAEGRLLPEEAIDEAELYTALRFYNYALGAPHGVEVNEAQADALRRYAEQSRHAGLHPSGADEPLPGSRGRHPDFLDSVFGFSRAIDADRAMHRMRFLNITTRVHPKLVEPLRRIEAEIRDAMAVDGDVATFVRNLVQVSGFYWREIPGTRARSYHAYGTAVDLLPRMYNGFGYWRWAMVAGVDEWWKIPLSERHQIPQAVVDAFERNGFVWGGKWTSFDPVHFEYRPEVIAAARAAALEPVERRYVESPAAASILR